MGAGETCTDEQRAAVVDLWARHYPPEHLIVACWDRHQLDRTLRRGMRALVLLRCDTDNDLFRELAKLPTEAIAYTNARYSKAVLTAAVIGKAREQAGMPSAVKLSKVSFAELANVRAAGGASLYVLHGSSRNIAGSFAAGVNLVVSSPLAALPQPWPAPTLLATQHAPDQVQRVLDAQRTPGTSRGRRKAGPSSARWPHAYPAGTGMRTPVTRSARQPCTSSRAVPVCCTAPANVTQYDRKGQVISDIFAACRHSLPVRQWGHRGHGISASDPSRKGIQDGS
jgi:hypothetical protein